ncbi:MAG: hypothetical protein WCS88_01460 [Patescibacteria group bacterium]|jgi:hypothetical protein
MEEDKRKKILLAIVIVILLLAFLLWVLRTSDQSPIVNENTNTPPPVFTPPSTVLQYDPTKVVGEDPTEFSAINLAKSYVARFGSWSTDNQGANLSELLSLSTVKMQNYLKNIKLNFGAEEFRGVTTKSISAQIIVIDDTSAQILVNTQKIETNAKLEENVYYQETQVDLLKVDDKWLVDQVIWK